LAILGAGESGVGAAILAQKEGYAVFVSDKGKITEGYKKELGQHRINWEEGRHSTSKILGSDVVVKSPGIPEEVSIVKEVKNNGIPVISEVEFAARFTEANLI